MFLRCTSRHKLIFIAVLGAVITINTFTLLFNYKEYRRLSGEPVSSRRPHRLLSSSSITKPSARWQPPRPGGPARSPSAAAAIIISYEGAGGSAVSQLLNLLPGVSHHHLPLAPLDEEGIHNGIEPLAPATLSAGLRLLDDTLRCNLTVHAGRLLYDNLWRQHALRTVFLQRCVPQNVSVAACLERVCRAATTVSAHVIRPFVSDLRPLLARWRPRLRLVLVQRDPRAVLASRQRRGVGLPLVTETDWTHAARALCSRMLQDVELSDQEEAGQPGFRKILLYEHLLERPAEVARLLYNFLGLAVTVEQLDAVLHQAQLETARATAWKADVAEPLLRAADRGCAHFYDASMYTALDEIRDLHPDEPLHGGIPESDSDVI